MAMKFRRFSKKQLITLSWWIPNNPLSKHDAIICDGAVRSGKTLSLSISFILWSLYSFDSQSFALCGKTIAGLRRNVVSPLKQALEQMGFSITDKISRNVIEISHKNKSARYYLFGGKDEGSADLIQGVTLAGVLLDEVALMPRSFVEQALARCSVEGSRFWFSCNPSHPHHWFYSDWIQKKSQRNCLYLHFTMDDNPSLSKVMKNRYKKLYTGAFYQRYVQGRWVAAHGAVYPMFSQDRHIVDTLPELENYIISCDYGTVNPASFGLWGYLRAQDRWYRAAEFYHDSRREGVQLTDEQYCDALEKLAGDLLIERVVVDPSAASFITCIRKRGRFRVVAANNDVAMGIRQVAMALSAERLKFHKSCNDCIREFSLYRWNLDAGKDLPHKEDDHAMDDVRYFVATVLCEAEDMGFAACCVSRG